MPRHISHSLDIHIGQRIRLRRKTMGISQVALGKEMRVSFQQIQKYENGKNSVSARRLYEFAKVLKVSPLYFYDAFNSDELPVEFENITPQAQRLLHDFNAISSASVRKQIVSFVGEMVKGRESGL